jgi:hypothetical protein
VVVSRQLLVAGCWLLVAGCWLLVAGCWLLVAGCRLAGGSCQLLVVSRLFSVEAVAGCLLNDTDAVGARADGSACSQYFRNRARTFSYLADNRQPTTFPEQIVDTAFILPRGY